MIRSIHNYLLLIGIIGFSILLVSFKTTDPFIQQIIDYFYKLQGEFPVEKVHLHIDNDSYTLGDDIWFSAYVTAGGTQSPSPLSKTLYVFLYDSDGILISKKIVMIENGFGHGDFRLPEFGAEGIYTLKAYTAWMENFGDEYFYHQEINVIDGESTPFYPKVTFKKHTYTTKEVSYQTDLEVITTQGKSFANETLLVSFVGENEILSQRELLLNELGQASFSFSLPSKPYKSQWMELAFQENGNQLIKRKIKIPYAFQFADVQFLPEGGNLLNGYNSTVAFKGVYPDGSPVEFKGEVLDQEEPIYFHTVFGGMGKFDIQPRGRPLVARVQALNGKDSLLIPLPKSEEQGVIVKVINNPNQAYITVYAQGNLGEEPLTLVSHSRGIMSLIANGNLPNGIWSTRIQKRLLQHGINHITILSREGNSLVERLFFHWNNEEKFELSISKKTALSHRSLVVLEMEALLNQIGHGGRFSISISDADQNLNNSHIKQTILTNLLLNSDLKGQIHLPNRFLEDRNDSTLLILDLVMMTNGWRRFNWKDVFSNTYPPIHKPIEQGITLKGNLKPDVNSRRGLKGGSITALLGNGESILNSTFGENGQFIFPNLIFYGETPITISAKDERMQELVAIDIQQSNPYFNKVWPTAFDQVPLSSSLVDSFKARQLMRRLTDGERYVELQEFEVQSSTLSAESLDQRRIYGKGDAVILPNELPGSQAFINIFEMIQGRVAGVQVSVIGTSATVTIRGTGSIGSGTEPFFLLDNMPVDVGTLMLVNPRDVEAIDVFKDPIRTSVFGSQGANGAIAVYLKSGAGLNNIDSPGRLVTSIEGFSVAKEFYQPIYETKTIETANPDHRRTIYWNPNLVLDGSGKQQIEFYNSDIAKSHYVVIEGMDSNGRILRYEKILR